MKNYVVKNNEHFISEYIEEQDYLKVKYANGTKKFYYNSEKNKMHLNEKMIHQYENYTYNPIIACSYKDIFYAVPSGCVLGILTTWMLINDGISLENIGATFSISSIGMAVMVVTIIGAVRAEKSERNHNKDTLFINNLELLKKKINDEEFCKTLSKNIRKKVIDIKIAGEELTLNTFNKFNFRQTENLIHSCKNEKTKVRKR